MTKLPSKAKSPQIATVSPEMATQLLEHNTHNRPISTQHVNRITRQIIDGKWRFNGDTIKVADTGDVLDGQHRLWAVVEAKKPIETIIVYGIARDAFATIDTVRKTRSGGDTLSLLGASRHRNVTASALMWLLRWHRGAIEKYRAPESKIENSDIENAFENNPGMERAVDRAMGLRRLCTPSIMAFLYYMLTNRNSEIAERMMATLENPAGVSINDPFFRLRAYMTADHHKVKDPLVTIALTLKAANAADKGQQVKVLTWRNQGKSPEAFPKLEVTAALRRAV